MRIIVFGDSISEGFYDYENGGWVNRLKIDYWKKYGYEKMVFNAGISAYTSENIINCFDAFFNAISRRDIGKEKNTIIIIATGINDSGEKIKTGNKRVELHQFEKNIEILIKKCQEEELIQNVIFLGATNVEEDVINDINNPGNEHLFYNSDIQKYNKIAKKLAVENTCSYIDVFGLLDSEDLEDGIHPSSSGHKKIYEKVLEFIEK